MKPAIFAFGFLLLAFTAHADVINVKLGQNAALEAGDVAIVGNGKMNTAITCNGPQAQPEPQLPSSQLFESKEFGKISGVWQANARNIGRDLAFQFICVNNSMDKSVQQAQASALIHARQKCANYGYSSCNQPANRDEQYVFRIAGEREGEYGCIITARIVGTMQ